MDQPLLIRNRAASGSSPELPPSVDQSVSSYAPPNISIEAGDTPGKQRVERLTERGKPFWQAIGQVFHEPEIPLRDKVKLGPIDKYIRFSNVYPLQPA
jgi:hypothetical protein